MKFKNIFICGAVAGLLMTSRISYAENAGDQGIGIILGNPTGLTGKMWLDHTWALDGAVGVDRGEFDIHADFLWHNYQFLKNLKMLPDNLDAKVPVYLGGGARILFAGDQEFGIRIPAGVSVLPNNTDWEFFGEIAPVLRLTPSVGFNGDISLGVRYYFRSIRPKGN